ncbi:MAG: hypothetical protein BYD32DRAFT_485175 [Podila humilis]|nr:MAG: hypothetical protein BYD32DRAFT_485175 [Podila humilis]
MSVKTLQLGNNLLSDLTSFGHLINLQYLDIFNNGMEGLTGLSSLLHLRDLSVESNKVESFQALQHMDALIRLNLSRNCITQLDFRCKGEGIALVMTEFINSRKLYLSGNPMTRDSKQSEELQRHLGSGSQNALFDDLGSPNAQDWLRRDIGFWRSLLDTTYVKQSVYRSAVMRSCSCLTRFDGEETQTKERERIPVVLGDLLDTYGRDYLDQRHPENEDLDFDDAVEQELQAAGHDLGEPYTSSSSSSSNGSEWSTAYVDINDNPFLKLQQSGCPQQSLVRPRARANPSPRTELPHLMNLTNPATTTQKQSSGAMQEAALVGLEGQELDDDFASVGAGRRTAVQDWEDEINQVISTSIKLTRSSPLTLEYFGLDHYQQTNPSGPVAASVTFPHHGAARNRTSIPAAPSKGMFNHQKTASRVSQVFGQGSNIFGLGSQCQTLARDMERS